MGDRVKFLTSAQSDWMGDLEARLNAFLDELGTAVTAVSLVEIKGAVVAVIEYAEAGSPVLVTE